MTQEEAIEVYNGLINEKIKEAFEFFAPELRESEDERIRKEIIAFIKAVACKTAISEERESKWIFYLEKQKEKITKVDACSFPLRDEGESACSYLERCLSPDMRNIWYEACSEIRGKQKSDSECNSNCATYKSHRES